MLTVLPQYWPGKASGHLCFPIWRWEIKKYKRKKYFHQHFKLRTAIILPSNSITHKKTKKEFINKQVDCPSQFICVFLSFFSAVNTKVKIMKNTAGIFSVNKSTQASYIFRRIFIGLKRNHIIRPISLPFSFSLQLDVWGLLHNVTLVRLPWHWPSPQVPLHIPADR